MSTRSAVLGKAFRGATVVEPLASSQWAPLFGRLTDRFGVTWVVDVVADYSAS
ncbi:MAG: hypothetical protein ICV57_10545 [Rubrobacter sp.]|nr:hypothetical protein [Rubrobacter sp.]